LVFSSFFEVPATSLCSRVSMNTSLAAPGHDAVVAASPKAGYQEIAGHGGPFAIAVAVGYDATFPPLGSLDVERAREVAVRGQCQTCGRVERLWSLKLPRPFPISGDEPWLAGIQEIRRCATRRRRLTNRRWADAGAEYKRAR
jgi:hypothetical protein